jgi:hypothetical protein
MLSKKTISRVIPICIQAHEISLRALGMNAPSKALWVDDGVQEKDHQQDQQHQENIYSHMVRRFGLIAC